MEQSIQDSHRDDRRNFMIDAPRLRQASERLRAYISGHDIGSVLVGISGGADSVLTLHLLRVATRGLQGFRLAAAHVNFTLRGEESERDENFVRNLLERMPDVEPHFMRADTLRYCAERGISVEMGARELRHDWFDALRKTHGYERLATGHNAGDNEETLLLNLMRGSGSRGLRGMEYDNGRILRPLLHMHREEIVEMIGSIPASMLTDPPYITDSTNLSDDYRRNFLRHKVIPMLEERWAGCHTALQTTLRIMAEENRIVEQALENALRDTESLLPWEKIRNFASPVSLIHRWIQHFGGTPAIAAEMASALRSDGAAPRAGGRWMLGNVEITSTAAGLRAARVPEIPGSDSPEDNESDRPAPPRMKYLQIVMTSANRDEVMAQVRNCDADSIYLPLPPDCLEWRHPREGEKMRIGEKARKPINHILKEAGVTAALRGSAWILADRRSGEPLWIPGIRRSFSSRVSGMESEIWHISDNIEQ